MQINPYLNFDGNCREAMQFYGEVLGGVPDIMSFGDSPMRDEMPAGSHDRVMHAHLAVDGAVLMASDTMPGTCGPEGVANGNIALSIDDVERAQKVFDAFAAGGEVTMPMQETFWVERFGMVTDPFGVSWLINGGRSKF